MAIDIIQQTPPPPPKSSTKNHQTTSSSSQTTTSTTTMSTATTTTSSTTTSSSRRSLASLRSSLPDNPHLYDISEIRHATNNFLSKNIYTSSSSSSSSSSSLSWRCTLHGKDVIIFQHKRDNSSSKPLTRHTAAKKLSTLCRSHHVAVVPLLGASLSGDSHVFLVYDFVLHGSSNLSELLHNKINNNNNNSEYTVLGSWMSRVQVASDVANGLDYIHNNSTGLDVTCVHNHVRSSSVIVTEQKQQRRQGQETTSFGAKLCHYGVSELCGEATEDRESVEFGVNGEIEEVGTTSFRKLRRSNSVKFNGTTGYMSPEFQVTGIGTRKSDVYAFGVILIELLSGEEPVKFKFDKSTKEYKKISVVDAAKALVEDDIGEREGKIRKWIDRRLRDSYPVDVAEKLTRLAVDCVHVDPNKRPDMRRVAGKISKLYLESKAWCEKMSVPTDFTVSFAPR